MAGKQRRPEQAPAPEGPRPAPSPAGWSFAPEVAPAPAPAASPWSDGLGSGGNPLVERVALALCVPPRAPETTARLVEIVARSALPEARKVDVRDRLVRDQDAADRVSAAVVRAFGRDDADLRASLVEGARRASDHDLAEVVAAHVGAAPAAVRALCDDLGQWVGWWWDEEEDEERPPGDYAAEESGA